MKFDEQNASGESANCPTIINGFVASKVDLIMANATPALTAATSATADIPILGTSVTDYASALEIDNWNGTVGGNVSGTSDLAPLDEQAAMLQELFPDAKKVGLLYCSAESNSKYQVDVIKGYLEAAGLTCAEYAFTDTNDVASVTQKACDDSDVIYIPTDNTAASNTEALAIVTASFTPPAAPMWLSFKSTPSDRLYLWLFPPPTLTEYFSKILPSDLFFVPIKFAFTIHNRTSKWILLHF